MIPERGATGRPWPVLSWVPGYQRSWLRFDLLDRGRRPEAGARRPVLLLAALEERLSLELAAAGGASGKPAAPTPASETAKPTSG